MESFLGEISRNLYPEPEVMKTRAKGPADEPTPEEAALVARGSTGEESREDPLRRSGK